MQRHLAVLSVSALLLLAACGGSDEGGPNPSDAAAPADAVTDDGDEAGTDSPNATRSGQATLTMEGTTHSFIQAEPGPDDDFYSFCTIVGQSLQAVLQEVDDAGNFLGGELSVVLLEPGGAYEQTGDPAEFSVQLGEFRFLRAEDDGSIQVPSQGSSASGTVLLTEDIGFGDDGTRQTAETEAQIEVSC